MKPCDKTKVLFVLPTLGAGGAERILITLMNNLDRTRFDVHFLALNEDGPIREWIADDLTFHSFGRRSIKTSVLKMISFMRRERPDVVFTTMVHSNALALLMKVLFRKTRVVVREAALPSVLISRYGFKGRLCTFVYKLLYPFADLVVSNCSQMVDDFQNKIKIKTDNHRVLFNPVDVARLYSSLPNVFVQDDVKTEMVRFVSVGRLSYEKGYDRLLAELSARDMPFQWRLDLVGDGAYRTVLEDLIVEKGLEDRVFLHGYHSNPWKIAAQADCLLLPSRWEGMPNVVLEGFACGVPAIAMREAGGILDIQKHSRKDALQVVDTIKNFVSEMEKVKPQQKVERSDSMLSPVFSLPHIMEEFENILVG